MWGFDCGKCQFFWSNFGYIATKKHVRDVKNAAALGWDEKTQGGTLVVPDDDEDLWGNSDMTLLHNALTEDYDRWSLTIGLRCPMVHGESKVTYPVVDELLPSGRRKDLNFSSMVLIAKKPAVDEGFSTAPEPPLPPRRDRFDIESFDPRVETPLRWRWACQLRLRDLINDL